MIATPKKNQPTPSPPNPKQNKTQQNKAQTQNWVPKERITSVSICLPLYPSQPGPPQSYIIFP